MRAFLLLFSFCFFLSANAGLDIYSLGNGHNGILTVSSATVVNSYAGVTSPITTGDKIITVSSSAGFSVGDLIMIWQATGLIPAPASGSAAATDMTALSVGRWELTRIQSVSGTSITVTTPFTGSFASGVTQMIRVPEYTSVTVNSPGYIYAPAWNGSTGGIVAFLCSGTVTLNTTASVKTNGLGFRGGFAVSDVSGATGSTGLDEAAPTGAQKGEGLANTRYGASQTGRGNVTNAGGGGVAYLAGGGGGGHRGAGGRGGNSELSVDGNRAVGGLGGATVSTTDYSHLVFGGGGGAGHSGNGSATTGGAGGGVVFIRCAAATGSGAVQCNGISPTAASSDGGSGGGGGGTVYLRSTGSVTVPLSASGGIGGSVNDFDMGPGGGGGGGFVLYQRSTGSSTISVNGGSTGSQQDASAPGGSAYGAIAGGSGVSNAIAGAMPTLSAPTLSAPASGALTGSKPTVTGTTSPVGSTVAIYIDNVLLGTVISSATTGTYSFSVPTALSNGAHTVDAYVSSQSLYSVPASSSFTSLSTLPVHFISFTAVATTVQGRSVVATNFTVSGESNIARYRIERSAGNGFFEPLGTVLPKNTSGLISYSFIDETPLNGPAYYRVEELDADGSAAYSLTAAVKTEKAIWHASLSPNPVGPCTALHFYSPMKQTVNYSVMDAGGRLVFHGVLQVQAGDQQVVLNLQGLATGIFHLRLYGALLDTTLSFVK